MEKELIDIYSLPMKEFSNYENEEDYVDDVLLDRVQDFRKDYSYHQLLENHAKLLEYKSKETGFDLYGDSLNEKPINPEDLKGFGFREDIEEEEITQSKLSEVDQMVEESEDIDFFDEDTYDIQQKIEKEKRNETMLEFQNQLETSGEELNFESRFDRLDKQLKEMIVSNHAPTSDLAFSILSSQEYKDLIEFNISEKKEQKEKIQKQLEKIMAQVENGQFVQKPKEKLIVNVNELIDEKTMVQILGKDVVETLNKNLKEGILHKTWEDIENEPTTTDAQVTDLLNSYFFVGML